MRALRTFALTLPLLGCGSPPMALREPDELDAITGMGCGSDENWRTFDDQELTHQVKTDDAQATYFLPPLADGAALPSSPKPTFQWQPSLTLVGKPHGDATCTECPTCGLLTTDHLPPVSGDVYDLQLAVGGAAVYRIIYTSQSWTPPDALWSSWRGKTVTLSAVRMTLKVNDVMDGPYQASKPLTFSVGN